MLAESGNLLMMPRLGVPRDQEGWIRDCKLLVDAGAAALKAARARDLNAILALNEQIVTSCTTCHADYRPNYRRRSTK
jgi:cytochrome c556